jgi:integrase
MGLVLKYVERTKAGSWQYRRRVPQSVSAVITKREFKSKLGESEREALAAYPRYHAEVERLIEAAKRGQAVAVGSMTEREAYAEALRRRADLVMAGTDEAMLYLAGDVLADRYPHSEAGPVGVPPVDRHTINLLRMGPERYKAPEPTLGDARRLYLKERLCADNPATDNRPVDLTNRVVDAAIDALGRDPALSSLTRDDARQVRGHMLDRVKVTGKGAGGKVNPATVSRELSILSAVFNFAKVEFGLPETLQNPFSRLPVAGDAKGQGQKDSEKRDPLPADVLVETRKRIMEKASPELALIWRLIEATGCRLAEVSGLRVEDVKTEGDLPHIRIEPHPLRSLKTKSSQRQVPLVGDALAAAEAALEAAAGGDMLFPSYGRRRGSDAASAALMKHLRAVSDNERHVLHSLRHNMKDRLILAEVSSLDQNLILGHALGSVGDRVYGGSVAKLRVTTRAMEKALAVRLE